MRNDEEGAAKRCKKRQGAILYLVVTLAKRLGAELAPDVARLALLTLLLERERAFHGGLDVSASEGEAEAGLGVADEVQRNLREALGLEVGDDGAAAKAGVLDHVHDLSVLKWFGEGGSSLETRRGFKQEATL